MKKQQVIEFLENDGAKIIYADDVIDLSGKVYESPVIVVFEKPSGVMNFANGVAYGYAGCLWFHGNELAKQAIFGDSEEAIFKKDACKRDVNYPAPGLTLIFNDGEIKARSPN